MTQYPPISALLTLSGCNRYAVLLDTILQKKSEKFVYNIPRSLMLLCCRNETPEAKIRNESSSIIKALNSIGTRSDLLKT